MKRCLLIVCLVAFACTLLSSCRNERTIYHTKNGRIRQGRTVRLAPWHVSSGPKYNKPAKYTMRRWKFTRK